MSNLRFMVDEPNHGVSRSRIYTMLEGTCLIKTKAKTQSADVCLSSDVQAEELTLQYTISCISFNLRVYAATDPLGGRTRGD